MLADCNLSCAYRWLLPCRERITHTCTHHTKGVHSFVWCHAYSCFASCGLERDVTVWHVSAVPAVYRTASRAFTLPDKRDSLVGSVHCRESAGSMLVPLLASGRAVPSLCLCAQQLPARVALSGLAWA